MPIINFNRPSNRALVKQLTEQAKKVKKKDTVNVTSGSIMGRIKTICDLVQQRLGHFESQICLIQTKEDLHNYIDSCIKAGIVAIDTETTGLDPITDQIVGVCLATRNEKAAYIPINHISYITNQRVNGQLTEQECAEELQRIVDNKTKTIFFNAKFDIRVIHHQLGVNIIPDWCGFIASKCLKNNEIEASLKYLWKKYCSPDKDAEHFTFEKMFKGIKFNLIPITTAYLYAAHDATMTLDLYDFQLPYLTETDEKCKACGFEKIAKLYREIELPIISTVAKIEDSGVCIDIPYSQELSQKYSKLLQEAQQKCWDEIEKYRPQIEEYKAKHTKVKMEDPINLASPDQLAELFYDVFKTPVIDKKKPRGTGEDILERMDNSVAKLIVSYRKLSKLMTTYIDKLPATLNKKTGRIHCSFNQYGTDTGRFSSSDPNLQNIPSHNKDIRPMFMASKYAYVKSQENKLSFLIHDSVPTLHGEKNSQDLLLGDVIICDDGNHEIQNIVKQEEFIIVEI